MSSNTEKLESQEGLREAANFIKFSLTLSSGTLVFSAGIIDKSSDLCHWAKIFLVISWLALGISIASGVLTYTRIPVMVAKKNYDLRDKYFELPGRIHQVFFVIGSILLGVALSLTLF